MRRSMTLAMFLSLALPLLGCGSSTAPPEVAGTFITAPFRFDLMSLTIDVGPGGMLSGAGFVMNDVGDQARYTVSGRYPEVTFTISTDDPGIIYYDDSRFRGVFRNPDEIAGTLTLAQGRPEVLDLTFRRSER
jgi:hypothetical protein